MEKARAPLETLIQSQDRTDGYGKQDDGLAMDYAPDLGYLTPVYDDRLTSTQSPGYMEGSMASTQPPEEHKGRTGGGGSHPIDASTALDIVYTLDRSI